MAYPSPNILVPKPRDIRVGNAFPTPQSVALRGPWSEDLAHSFDADANTGWSIEIQIDAEIPSQHYRLNLTSSGAVLQTSDRSGAWNGLQTTRQWLQAHQALPQISALSVVDGPDFVRRGITLDISRCRVPQMSQLYALVDSLAGWKINQLQLYTEHTFAYAGHKQAWNGCSPITAEEIHALSTYCAQREVRLVPNQNSLGHFHRWLKHAAYRPLAECPQGIEHPFSSAVEPYGLCATDPRVFDLLSDLYGQLLPQIDGDRVHVGCDETIDLGRCRSKSEAAARGVPALFTDYVLRLRQLAARWDRKLEIWADTPLANPEMVDQLPDDVRLQVWGYEAEHPFDQQLSLLHGRDIDICPGTSSWCSLAGRSNNALANLSAAAQAGVGHAAGYVITDWGDYGHPQPPSVSTLGYLAGSDLAWNAVGRASDQYRVLLQQHLGDGIGAALFDLGTAHEALATPCFNGTPLFHLLFHWQDSLSHGRYRGLGASDLKTAKSAIDRVADPGSHSLKNDILWLRKGLQLSCDLGLARLEHHDRIDQLPPRVRADLADRLATWRSDYAELWLSTSRTGGFDESVAPLESLGAALSTG